MRTPIAKSCPACGYILSPETGTCLQCGYGEVMPQHPEAENENWWQDQGI